MYILINFPVVLFFCPSYINYHVQVYPPVWASNSPPESVWHALSGDDLRSDLDAGEFRLGRLAERRSLVAQLRKEIGAALDPIGPLGLRILENLDL